MGLRERVLRKSENANGFKEGKGGFTNWYMQLVKRNKLENANGAGKGAFSN